METEKVTPGDKGTTGNKSRSLRDPKDYRTMVICPEKRSKVSFTVRMHFTGNFVVSHKMTIDPQGFALHQEGLSFKFVEDLLEILQCDPLFKLLKSILQQDPLLKRLEESVEESQEGQTRHNNDSIAVFVSHKASVEDRIATEMRPNKVEKLLQDKLLTGEAMET